MKKRVDTKVRTVGEEEGFIALLRVACADRSVNDPLEKLLSQPDDRRKALVHNWVSELVVNGAPPGLRACYCLPLGRPRGRKGVRSDISMRPQILAAAHLQARVIGVCCLHPCDASRNTLSE